MENLSCNLVNDMSWRTRLCKVACFLESKWETML